MAQFRLLAGLHICADPSTSALTPEQVKAGVRRSSKTFKEGETVESEDDLVVKHGAAKFVLVSGTPKKEGSKTPSLDKKKDESPPQTREEVEQRLQKMNVMLLKEFAQDRGIDLTGKVTKAEMAEHVLAVLDD